MSIASALAFLWNPAFWSGAAGAATVAGAGTGIASAAGAFDKGKGGIGSITMPATVDAAKANEEARKEEMRRRRIQTKTLLTGSQGALGEAGTTKKVLLGA